MQIYLLQVLKLKLDLCILKLQIVLSTKKTGAADTDWQPYSEIEGGGLLWETASAATTADVSKGYFLDSSGSSFAITLPATPEIGDIVGFAGGGNLETNNVTVDLNGNNMNGATDNLTIDLNYCYFEMLYTNATTGWVISNTDESGNVADIVSFIGSGDNTDPAVTEFTEENIVTGGESLETAIDNLDIEAGDVRNFIGKDGDVDDLPNYTERSAEVGGSYAPNYVTDGDDLELGVAKLDKGLQDVSSIANAGVSWRAFIAGVTGDDPTGMVAADAPFSDDEAPLWTWATGEKVLSLNAASLGTVFEFDGSAWVDAGEPLTANQAVAVKHDLPDVGGTQEDGAAYKMNEAGDAIIKIADFDLETAASISLSTGYTSGSGDVTSTDTVESAIQKVDGNNDAQDSVLGVAQGDTDLGSLTENNVIVSGDTVKNGLDELDIEAADVRNFIGKDADADDMPNYSERDVEVGGLYSPINVADGDDLELSIAKIDKAIQGISKSTKTSIDASTQKEVDFYFQTGNIGSKFIVFVWDGSGSNAYASEIYALHNNSGEIDFTEYAILELGSIGSSLDVSFEVISNAGMIYLVATNNQATSVTVKVQRTLINMD
jgi:hypothetical protein